MWRRNDPKTTATARAIAAECIFDRAYSKAPQFINTTDAEQFRRICDMSDEELAAIITVAGALPASAGSDEPEAEQPPHDPKKVN